MAFNRSILPCKECWHAWGLPNFLHVRLFHSSLDESRPWNTKMERLPTRNGRLTAQVMQSGVWARLGLERHTACQYRLSSEGLVLALNERKRCKNTNWGRVVKRKHFWPRELGALEDSCLWLVPVQRRFRPTLHLTLLVLHQLCQEGAEVVQ